MIVFSLPLGGLWFCNALCAQLATTQHDFTDVDYRIWGGVYYCAITVRHGEGELHRYVTCQNAQPKIWHLVWICLQYLPCKRLHDMYWASCNESCKGYMTSCNASSVEAGRQGHIKGKLYWRRYMTCVGTHSHELAACIALTNTIGIRMIAHIVTDVLFENELPNYIAYLLHGKVWQEVFCIIWVSILHLISIFWERTVHKKSSGIYFQFTHKAYTY